MNIKIIRHQPGTPGASATVYIAPPPPPPPYRRATMIRRSLRLLMLPALFVACAQAQAQSAPVAQNNTIYVPAGLSYTFSAGDFPFGNANTLTSVHFETAPANATGSITSTSLGVLQSDGQFELTRGVTVVGRTIANIPLADIGTVKYFPRSADMPMAGYTTFTWTANSEGPAATITVDLVPSTNTAATGAPTVTAASGVAYNEDAELIAGTAGITEPNGIPTHRRSWQWQQSATQAGTYENIAGATADAFTPGREHIGQYIRVCLRFTDGIGTEEGGDADAPTLCTTGAIIARANSVSVPITADADAPYRFKPSDFMFPNDPTGALKSVPVITTIASGRGTFLLGGSVAIADNLTVNGDSIRNGELIYYPPEDSAAAPNFASFTYMVNYDGTGNTEARTMNIHLVEHLSLRLRLFLEGPLR